MAYIYTRSDYKARINAKIKGKIGMLLDEDETANDAARDVADDIDLLSLKRKATLSPSIFTDIFQYTAPADISGNKIIDIPDQAKTSDNKFFLVTPEEFRREKNNQNGIIALDEFNGIKQLLISLDVNDKGIVVSTLDNLTSGGGTWTAFGDATNLARDADDFIKESGSISWDINSAGGTTAGIKNTGLNSFDLDDEFLGGNGAAFVWHKINSTTNMTNQILHLGSNDTNYHQKIITSAHDGTGFVTGWQLLRFDLTSLSDTGTPNDDAITYAALYMTKTTGKINETDYKYDWLVIKKGVIYEIKYYSNFPWNNTSGAYLRESTDNADVLVAERGEYKLFILKGAEYAADEIDEHDLSVKYRQQYEDEKKKYLLQRPSEGKIMTTEYYKF